LDTTPHSDTHREIKFPLAGDDDGCGMFGGVTDNGNDDEGDPLLRNVRVGSNETFKRIDEVFRSNVGDASYSH